MLLLLLVVVLVLVVAAVGMQALSGCIRGPYIPEGDDDNTCKGLQDHIYLILNHQSRYSCWIYIRNYLRCGTLCIGGSDVCRATNIPCFHRNSRLPRSLDPRLSSSPGPQIAQLPRSSQEQESASLCGVCNDVRSPKRCPARFGPLPFPFPYSYRCPPLCSSYRCKHTTRVAGDA